MLGGVGCCVLKTGMKPVSREPHPSPGTALYGIFHFVQAGEPRDKGRGVI